MHIWIPLNDLNYLLPGEIPGVFYINICMKCLSGGTFFFKIRNHLEKVRLSDCMAGKGGLWRGGAYEITGTGEEGCGDFRQAHQDVLFIELLSYEQ